MTPVPQERGENLAVVTADPAATHGKSNDASDPQHRENEKHVGRSSREFRVCLRERPKPE